MKHIALALFLLMVTALAAKDPPGFGYWSGAELKAYGAKLAPKVNAQKVASLDLAKYGDHWVSVSYREGSGESEFHENQADMFVVESGEATLVVGGKVVNGKTTGPGEIRGSSIQGGEKKKLVPGDIVHIPAKTPHQLLLAPGQRFTYFVVKITAR
jgi:mannose-6-phosphate isomerase-like protein (cupin superfamily)